MPTFKQLITALKYTVLTFATTHLVVSYLLMFTRDYQEGNLFRILNYQKLFPGMDIGWESFVISNVIAVGVYFGFLAFVLIRSGKAAKSSDKDS